MCQIKSNKKNQREIFTTTCVPLATIDHWQYKKIKPVNQKNTKDSFRKLEQLGVEAPKGFEKNS